ncbi:Sec-independent protein translocase protein TatB [Croceicoccus sp. BE223]|uniref:Sec-independent protein translocase protein TatB n=1 Tax=Croceicoccus sp. BE223 TaxID=2817716 RepID=UPI00285E899A|nr:Sec-independent protein translocase protein TatB [Croceicoccus sp. BE223]MDR7101782.1 sec-independent protein translocase protein TatB [Croceicoccus sp. BE223]
MFDIGATELLLIVIVAVIVIGPKDLPLALRTAGRWIGKMRRVSAHFRSGLDAMVREAELEDMQKEWDRRNAEIMRQHPSADPETGRLDHAAADVASPAPSSEKPPVATPDAKAAAKSAAPEAPPSVAAPPTAPTPTAEPGSLPLFDDPAPAKPAKD